MMEPKPDVVKTQGNQLANAIDLAEYFRYLSCLARRSWYLLVGDNIEPPTRQLTGEFGILAALANGQR